MEFKPILNLNKNWYLIYLFWVLNAHIINNCHWHKNIDNLFSKNPNFKSSQTTKHHIQEKRESLLYKATGKTLKIKENKINQKKKKKLKSEEEDEKSDITVLLSLLTSKLYLCVCVCVCIFMYASLTAFNFVCKTK